MGWKEIVCDSLRAVLKAGVPLAEAALTAFLTPEIDGAAPFVAGVIGWLADKLGNGILDWACDTPSAEELLRKAIHDVTLVRGIGRTFLNALEQKAEQRRELFKQIEAAPSSTPAKESATITRAPLMPLNPAEVSGVTSTPFTPRPITISMVNVGTWPRMDSPEAKRFLHWDRYQGTWNGQPHATFPKVGF